MSESGVVFIVIGFGVVLGVIVLSLVSRSSSAMREMLRNVATTAGWMDVQNLRLRAGVRGTWRSFAVSVAYLARQKSTPQRITIDIGAHSDVRLSIRRRFSGFFSNKPLTWFGPPLVELRAPAAADFWVRSDELNLAERLFADGAVAEAIDATLVARFDELKVNRNGLRIIRAIDEKPVQSKYGIAFSFRVNPADIELLAKEEWNAAEALVNKLSLM